MLPDTLVPNHASTLVIDLWAKYWRPVVHAMFMMPCSSKILTVDQDYQDLREDINFCFKQPPAGPDTTSLEGVQNCTQPAAAGSMGA